jgi:outer membrane autotransporter protein
VSKEDNPELLANAFAQLHGEVFASGQMASVNMQRSFQRYLPSAYMLLSNDSGNDIYRGNCGGTRKFRSAPLAALGDTLKSRKCRRYSVETYGLNRWASFTGDWQERRNIGDHSGYDFRSAGVAVGFDQRFSRNAFAGIAFGYDNAYQDFRTIQSRNQTDAFRSILYGGVKSGNVYADGYAGYTKSWHNTRRDINIDAFNGVARSKYSNDMFSTGFEVGRKFGFFTPSVGLHYIHLSTPGVTETGASDANLHVRSNSYNSLRLPIGAKLSRDIESRGLRPRSNIVWTPELRVHYIREMADDSVRVRTSFDNIRSVSFAADSGSWGRNSGRFGVGVNARLSNQLNFRMDYDYEVFDFTSASALSATLGVKW